jgi:hypothetical protein
MTAVGLLHCIHRERADCVDAELVEFGGFQWRFHFLSQSDSKHCTQCRNRGLAIIADGWKE